MGGNGGSSVCGSGGSGGRRMTAASARATKRATSKPTTPKGKTARSRAPTVKLPPAFSNLGPIASGAFSTIVKARHNESGTVVAAKAFKSGDAEHEILRLVSAAGHAHIANLLEEEAVDGGVLGYLQYCGGGSLAAHLAKMRKKQLAMNEANAVVLAAQIGSALEHCHALGVAHRDVKPANILYDGRRWRLCDFGFAVLARDRKLREQLGSILYCAPEILSGKSAYVGWPVDMWALGTTLYEVRRQRSGLPTPSRPLLLLLCFRAALLPPPPSSASYLPS